MNKSLFRWQSWITCTNMLLTMHEERTSVLGKLEQFSLSSTWPSRHPSLKEPSSDHQHHQKWTYLSTGFLGTEIKGEIFLSFIEFSQGSSLLRRQHCQYPCDWFTYSRTIVNMDGLACGYILVSLEALPPAIFWTRREASSCLSSSSCFVRSAFDRARSSLGLLVLLDYTN